MRILGRVGSLLVAAGFLGCGPASGLEQGVPEDAVYVPAPKIEFAKPKSARHSAKAAPATKHAPAPAAGEDKVQ